jgi:hypothetical protein
MHTSIAARRISHAVREYIGLTFFLLVKQRKGIVSRMNARNGGESPASTPPPEVLEKIQN